MENEEGTKECPYCAETIKWKARKCRFCGEFLDGDRQRHQQTTNVKDPVLAAVLSFVMPGLGQIYCGFLANGLVGMIICVPFYWVGVLTASKTIAFLVIALALHVVIIFDAYKNAQILAAPPKPPKSASQDQRISPPPPRPIIESDPGLTLASQIKNDDSASVSLDSQWQKYRTLAQEMLDAKNYLEAYKYASSALELVPTEPFCWAIKGVAAAYLSIPPDFRYHEMKSCLAVAIKSDDVLKIVPVLQNHIWDAARNYRKLAWEAKQHAHDDARKEGASDSVGVGLQRTMRNIRDRLVGVNAAQVKKHQPGYLLSVRATLYARNLNPSLMASKKALKEIDTDLNHSWIAEFKDDDGVGLPSALIAARRNELIAIIKKIDPTFQPPASPRRSGCFIATAATGDANHPYVTELRRFRDTCLTTSNVGRRAIQGYYRFSPRLAAVIAKRPVWRRLVYLGIVCPTAWGASAVLRIRAVLERSDND